MKPKFKPGDVIDRTNDYKKVHSQDFTELILDIQGDSYMTYRFMEGSIHNHVGNYHILTTDSEFTIIHDKSLIDNVKQQYKLYQLVSIIEK